jgi:hypothetical protein
MKNSAMEKVGATALVAVASLAFALPAPAAVRPDDRSGPRGLSPGSASAPVRPDDRSGVRGVSVANVPASVRADDRADLPAIGSTQSAAFRPDDRAGFRGTYLRTAAPTVASLQSDNGFDWSAAGAGAGSATALMLLVFGAALILRRNSRRADTPA